MLYKKKWQTAECNVNCNCSQGSCHANEIIFAQNNLITFLNGTPLHEKCEI